jgi:glutaredoxin
LKYANVKIVAKTKCQQCAGQREIDTEVGLTPCPHCHGTGEIDTPLLHDGEPFFLLRAQDKLSLSTVLMYQGLLRTRTDGQLDTDLEQLITRIQEWQEANPSLVKLPD